MCKRWEQINSCKVANDVVLVYHYFLGKYARLFSFA